MEGTTLAQLAFDPHPAFVAVCNRFNDRQAQTGALAFLSFFLTPAIELFEYAGEVDGGNPNPGINNGEDHLVFIGLDTHRHLAPGLRIDDGIFNQVVQGLL